MGGQVRSVAVTIEPEPDGSVLAREMSANGIDAIGHSENVLKRRLRRAVGFAELDQTIGATL